MQISYKNEQLEVKNYVFNTILEKINELIKDKNTIFSHLIIDGVEVYENHEAYIEARIGEIMQVEIITHTVKEMIRETMESIHEYLVRAVPSVQSLVNNSYYNFGEKSWNRIDQLSEGMQWMLQFKAFVIDVRELPSNWEETGKSFENCEEHFAQLLEAVEAQDMKQISNILVSGIMPAYDSLEKSIAESLNDQEFWNPVH